jgi:hypothetical protein
MWDVLVEPELMETWPIKFACCLPRPEEMGNDDAVARYWFLIATPFRTFFFLE